MSQVDAVGAPPVRSWDEYETGCKSTYRGGHHDERDLEIYQHGMNTVFNLLRAEFPPAEMCKAAPDLLAVVTAEKWLVWSIEHGAWWGPNHCRYYIDIDFAGRYSLEEALSICDLRSKSPNGSPMEMIVPSPELMEMRRAAIAKATASTEEAV